MAKKEMAIWTYRKPTRIVNRKWEHQTTHYTVEVMARAHGYAMVRRPKRAPFAVKEIELSPYTAGTEGLQP